MSSTDSKFTDKCADSIRCLAADMVRKANSGHPGAPIGMAAMATVLWGEIMNFAPQSPDWPNRDRFVLSNGHACALLYSMLHLTGYDLSIEDLKQFRQLHSKTPGHPENTETVGVEVTTGPLGQGIANATGMALAQTHLAANFNKPGFELFDNFTYVFTGDGCLQEGISAEAASLAGHWQLGKLIVIYDDNNIQIDGTTELAFTEDVLKRFEAYGWHTSTVVDGNTDQKSLKAAIEAAKLVTNKPSLIAAKTIIGYGSLQENTHSVHGSPLKPADITQLKKKFGFDGEAKFAVEADVYQYFAKAAQAGTTKEQQWNTLFKSYEVKYPTLAKELTRRLKGEFPVGWKDCLPSYKATDKAIATRNTSGACLRALADIMPELVGGSADLTPSNKTQLNNTSDFQAATPEGRYLRFGVREHAMCSIANGIFAYGALIPFTATFLNFIEYSFPAVRLTAISQFQQLLIMTHDSIGVGEDGPTHQAIEAVPICRATPNVYTFRPGDGNETVGCYISAMEFKTGPSVLCLSRQNCPQVVGSCSTKTQQGGYVIDNPIFAVNSTPDVILIATGSELGLAVDSAKVLIDEFKLNVRVVSMPCTELFDQQTLAYKKAVLTPNVCTISIEAAATFGWERYSHFQIGLNRYGLSAPGKDVYKALGLVVEKVVPRVNKFISHFHTNGSGLVTHVPASL